MKLKQWIVQASTPENGWIAALFGVLLLLLQPFFTFYYYVWNQHAGAYPVNADSVGIPIYYETLGWLIMVPFALLFAAWAYLPYPGKVGLWFWNNNRPYWSAIWSIIFGLIIVSCCLPIPYDLWWLNPTAIANDLLSIVLLLILRALVVAKKSWR